MLHPNRSIQTREYGERDRFQVVKQRRNGTLTVTLKDAIKEKLLRDPVIFSVTRRTLPDGGYTYDFPPASHPWGVALRALLVGPPPTPETAPAVWALGEYVAGRLPASDPALLLWRGYADLDAVKDALAALMLTPPRLNGFPTDWHGQEEPAE